MLSSPGGRAERGALPGRTEILLRIIGPRPNGFLHVSLVRFTVSRVKVWIEQLRSGVERHYLLEAVPRAGTELSGLVDREAFMRTQTDPGVKLDC